MADMMDKTIDSILTALIAVILIASAFIPTVINQINNLLDMFPDDGNATIYTGLLSVVVIITIVGIIVGVLKTYTWHGDEGDR